MKKIRMICMNCLYSKKLPIHPTDPEGTLIITTESCPKCDKEGEGMKYYDDGMNEVTRLPKA